MIYNMNQMFWGYAIVQTHEIDQYEQKINDILRPLVSGAKTGPI